MWERQKLFKKTCLYTSKKDKIEMTEVNEDQIDEYIEAYLADENRDGPGKNSFKKLSHVLVVWNTQQHLQKE